MSFMFCDLAVDKTADKLLVLFTSEFRRPTLTRECKSGIINSLQKLLEICMDCAHALKGEHGVERCMSLELGMEYLCK